MNDVQEKLSILRASGWTQQAIADELEVSWQAVHNWVLGQRHPENSKAVLMALETLATRKPPKRRRYAPGEHHTQRRSQEAED